METAVRSKKFIAKLIKSDIFHIKYAKNSLLNAEDFRQSYQCFLELGKGKPIKTLVEADKNAFIDTDVKSCAFDNIPVISSAKAYVIDSLSLRIFLSQSLPKSSSDQKVKIFKCKNTALDWLESLA